MTAVKRLDRETRRVAMRVEPHFGDPRDRNDAVYRQLIDRLERDLKSGAPECEGCPHRGTKLDRILVPVSYQEEFYITAFCKAGYCKREQEMATMNDLWTPGWTTSAPGDMKNGGGLKTRFAKPDIDVIPRTDFDLDIATRFKSDPETFKKEYMADFSGASKPFIDPELLRDRDTPEGSLEGAW